MTQGDCSNMSTGSGSQVSVLVQAMDHKFNLLTQGYLIWQKEIEPSVSLTLSKPAVRC